MKRTIYIYDNERYGTGVWASENLIPSDNGGDCEEIVVEIPDNLEPGENVFGDLIVGSGLYEAPLNDCLRVDKNGNPYIKPLKPGGRITRLKVLERVGRKSLSFTI